ncbi:MAG: type II secretion system protein N [Lautropia sp.]|nr:type II secretion system protein N [Lautropia sp.]
MRSSSVAVRLLSLLLFLVLIGIITYWAMQLLAPRAAIAPGDALGDNSRPPLPVAAKLFGARQATGTPDAPPPVDIKVTGIVEAGRRGVAILAIDGKPAKAFRVNQRVGDGSTLKEVHADKVVIEHRGQRIEADAPSRYSLDILTSNAGKSRQPTAGIGEPSEEVPWEDDTGAPPDALPPAAAGQPPFADEQPPVEAPFYDDNPALHAQPAAPLNDDPPPGGLPPGARGPMHRPMGGATMGRGMLPPPENYDANGQPLDGSMVPDASEFDPNAPMTGPGGSIMFDEQNAQDAYGGEGFYGEQPFIEDIPPDGSDMDPNLMYQQRALTKELQR